MAEPVNHLRVLKWLNWFSVGAMGLGALATVGTVGVTVAAVMAQAPEAAIVVLPTVLITLLITLLFAAMMALAAASALGIEHGRARVAQTVLAVFSLTSFPFGTAYGAYAIWLCWFNEETSARFEGGLSRELPRLMLGLGALALPLVPLIALSVSVAIPTQLSPLDAEWEPFEDRSRRQEGSGCALTEQGPDCTPARPTGVTTEEVRFPTRTEAMGFTGLNGTLHLPSGLDGPRPAVILVHGSGPADRAAGAPGELVATYAEPVALFEQLARHLASAGFVVLRYDKRACGHCYPEEHANADYSAFRFGLFVEDALAAADYLATRPEVRGDQLVVVGHSQGGGFAPHIAAADPRVVATVMLAGLSGTFRDGLIGQMEAISEIRAQQWDAFGAWGGQLQTQVFRGCLDKLDGAYDPADDCLGGGVSLQAVAEYDALGATTLAVVNTLPTPLCAIAGTVDRNVPPTALVALREAAGPDAEFHLIGGVGHGLTNLVHPVDPPQVDVRVLERIDGFLGTVRPGVADVGHPL